MAKCFIEAFLQIIVVQFFRQNIVLIIHNKLLILPDAEN